MERRRWTRALMLGLLGLSCSALFGGDARPAAALVSGSICVGLTLYGARHQASEVRRPLTLIACGAGSFLFANLVRAIHGFIAGVSNPFPSPADVFTYLGYASVIFGMLALIRARGGSEDRDNLIDALIVAAGVGVLGWALLLAPYVRQADIPFVQRLMTGGYSLLDLVLLTLTARVAVGPGARTISYYLLAAAMASVLAANFLTTLQSSGRYDGPLLPVVASFGYLFVAAAANHPSMRRLAEPALDT
ncbi:MAG: hypothetical protein M3Z46_09805, partial [Actinomycetota bacterium]|nr:hypothetical protein [Actinomycetota bacterium]